jgi:hypothetical protein
VLRTPDRTTRRVNVRVGDFSLMWIRKRTRQAGSSRSTDISNGMLQIRLIAISQAETPAHSHREALTDHPPKPGPKGIQAPAVNLRGLNDDLETGILLIYFWSCVLNRDLRGLSPCHGGDCSGTEGLLEK